MNVYLRGHLEIEAVLDKDGVTLPSGTKIVWDPDSPPNQLPLASRNFLSRFEKEGVFYRDRFLVDQRMSPSGAAALLLGRTAGPRDWVPMIQTQALLSSSSATLDDVVKSKVFFGDGAPSKLAREKIHIVILEESKGWGYRRLFSEYLAGAKEITIRDPYIRKLYQVRNLMELLVLVCETLSDIDRVDVHLITRADQDSPRQEDYLKLIEETFRDTNLFFTWKLDQSESFHARSIIIDSEWKILLDRGLDIFKPFPYGDFCLERHLQEKRFTKRTEVTFLKLV